MKIMLISSKNWKRLWGGGTHEDSVKTQVRQLLEQGGGDITLLNIYNSFDEASLMYTTDKGINSPMMRSHYALVEINDDNVVSLYYGRTEESNPKKVDDFECEANLDILEGLEEGVFYSQEEVESNILLDEFIDDCEILQERDYVAEGINKLHALVDFDWKTYLGRMPNSISRISNALDMDAIDDSKKIELAQKEMKSWNSSLKNIFKCFKDGYTTGDFTKFDTLLNQYRDDNQIDRGHDFEL